MCCAHCENNMFVSPCWPCLVAATCHAHQCAGMRHARKKHGLKFPSYLLYCVQTAVGCQIFDNTAPPPACNCLIGFVHGHKCSTDTMRLHGPKADVAAAAHHLRAGSDEHHDGATNGGVEASAVEHRRQSKGPCCHRPSGLTTSGAHRLARRKSHPTPMRNTWKSAF